MEITTNLRHTNLRSSFLTTTTLTNHRKPYFRPFTRPISTTLTNCINKHLHTHHHPIRLNVTNAIAIDTQTTTTSIDTDDTDDIESLFSNTSPETVDFRRSNNKHSGASTISSGVRLENISKSYKGVTVLKDVSWEVKKGEKVGLVGVNGAGKTTQLRIISGAEEPDSGNVIKVKPNMRISFLSQEFEVSESRTVREEFLDAFKEEMEVAKRLEKVQKAIEGSVEDLELMGRLLDEFDLLQRRAQAVNLDVVDVKISKLMPELGFSVEDSDRLVASFSGGWQMRMSLGKILLQDPDLLLLDEPTNHLDLDTIEWLEGYLNKQDVPMVIISHDRAFLDQLCTKIVETDMGVSRTFIGNYSDYIIGKASWIEAQFTAWEKQQKEIEHTRGLISRLSAGANSGRASTAEKVFLFLF
ncbi:putative ABC transporter, AAA+ ATPase domain, P-loop containing nucleoside triphosphate hydrolase [Helianthus anomalus]